MRKLIVLGLVGAGVVYVLRQREHQPVPSTAGGTAAAPGAATTSGAAAQPAPDTPTPEQTADTVESDAISPDTPQVDPVEEASGNDPEAFEQEIEEEGR